MHLQFYCSARLLWHSFHGAGTAADSKVIARPKLFPCRVDRPALNEPSRTSFQTKGTGNIDKNMHERYVLMFGLALYGSWDKGAL